MASYTQSEKKRILEYPIANILSHFGKRTDHHGQMYYSPFRDERTPSFHINKNSNVWMDFGTGEGGNVLTLVSQLARIPLHQTWDYIASLDPVIELNHVEQMKPLALPAKVIVDRVCDAFTYKALVDYAESRGIPQELLLKYCNQISYHLSNRPKDQWTAIGFRSNDGWVLRHAGNAKYSKRCTSSACSFLGFSGEITTVPTHKHIEVFEGFFDYLSWMTMAGKVVPDCDICVLNSVNNIRKGMNFITSHESISCWLDNDIAGNEAFEQIHELRKDTVSHKNLLEEHSCNDVNDLLLSSSKTEKKEINLAKNMKRPAGKKLKL